MKFRLLGRLLLFVPQRIGIYVGWVDVKGFLITPALRKSTHPTTFGSVSDLLMTYCEIGAIPRNVGITGKNKLRKGFLSM